MFCPTEKREGTASFLTTKLSTQKEVGVRNGEIGEFEGSTYIFSKTQCSNLQLKIGKKHRRVSEIADIRGHVRHSQYRGHQ